MLPVWDLDTYKAASTIVTTGSTLISELTADAKTTVTGNGSVQTAKLNASGCELVMQPAEVQLASGVTATIAGKSAASLDERFGAPRPPCPSTSTTRTTSPFPTNFGSMRTKNDLTRVNRRRQQPASGHGLQHSLPARTASVSTRTYLSTLSVGTYTAELKFEDGTKAAIGIVVSNSSLSAVSPSQVTFDKVRKFGELQRRHRNASARRPGTLLDTVKLAQRSVPRALARTTTTTQPRVRSPSCARRSLKEQGQLHHHLRPHARLLVELLADRHGSRAGQ
ncbi:MAG: hypothetical protein ACLR4Z_12815 [Butyricicoccaceae bacterium]